jgi:hypothetical protein
MFNLPYLFRLIAVQVDFPYITVVRVTLLDTPKIDFGVRTLKAVDVMVYIYMYTCYICLSTGDGPDGCPPGVLLYRKPPVEEYLEFRSLNLGLASRISNVFDRCIPLFSGLVLNLPFTTAHNYAISTARRKGHGR